jgi:peroxiredoxin
MALLETPAKDDAFHAIDFSLKGIDGNTYTLDNCKGEKGLLVMFICNHCPYVKALIDRLVEDCKILQGAGIGCVAIMPNDAENYPEDSFNKMKEFAQAHGFTFPYLIDETQETARAYGAVCTPDLYGFNADGELQYRGRVDSAGMNEPGPDMKHELREGMLQIAESGTGPDNQIPSMGCSIKWRE